MKRRALFLDRDGVINADGGYIWRPEDFVFLPGVFTGCRRAQAAGYLLVVVTNQSGIGRGLYGEDDFFTLTDWMCREFADNGVEIAEVYFAPTHPHDGIGDYRRESIDRKPGPGMLLRARDELGVDLAASALIGDKETDVEAGLAAGVAYTLLVAGTPRSTQADAVVASLAAGVDWLLDPERQSAAQKR